MFCADPPCELCGGETQLNTTSWCVSCLECGLVAQEHVIADDCYEAMTRCSPAEVAHVKRRKIDRYGGMKARVTSYVEHAGLGSAVATQCDVILDAMPPILHDCKLDAWAVIMMACELAKTGRSLDDLAKIADLNVGSLMSRAKALRGFVKQLFEDHVEADASDETLAAMNVALASIYGDGNRDKKIAARRHVRKRLGDVQHFAPFMNMRPKTRARALVIEHLNDIGYTFTAMDKDALEMNSTGVRNGLKRLRQAPSY